MSTSWLRVVMPKNYKKGVSSTVKSYGIIAQRGRTGNSGLEMALVTLDLKQRKKALEVSFLWR